MLEIYDIKTLHMQEPAGIDEPPYFSWKLRSDRNNTLQTAYQIRVCTKASEAKPVWDSQIVTTDRNTFVDYDGPALLPKTQYLVDITVFDNHEETAQASSTFETGFLGQNWEAVWVRTASRPKKRKKGFGRQTAPIWFRKNFRIEQAPVKARLYATAHGIYEPYINEKRPDERSFAPEHTVYEKYLCYQTYDITSLLKKGENSVALYTGDGWYHGPNTKPILKKYDGCYAVLFQMELLFADGSRQTICSDSEVVTSEGPVLSADLFAGEYYNAQMPCFGRDWQKGKVAAYGYENLHGQIGAPVMPVELLNPVSIVTNQKSEQIVDFGRNIAGRVRIQTRLPKGGQLILEHGEVLDREGCFINNIVAAGGVGKGVDQKDIYISDGKPAVYEPHFTYHGFRYVRVTGMSLEAGDIQAVVLSTAKEDLGTFSCSDADLNQLYANIRTSQTSNMLSIPTDCPQREKAGWTGDMLVYARTAMLNEDCTAFFDRWLKNMTCDQDKYGIIPMVTPNVGTYPMMGKLIHLSSGLKGAGTSSGWGDAAVMVPFSMYQITGDTHILRQQYDTMKKWVDYILFRCKNGKPRKCTRDPEIEQYLWDTGYHYGEWLIPSQSRNGMDMKNLKTLMAMSSCYTAPIFGWQSVHIFAEIARILAASEASPSYKEEAEFYGEKADKMKAAFQKCIIGEDGSMPSDLMGAYVLPICFDLVPEKFRQAFAEKLVKSIRDHGGTMDTGFLATPYLLDALVKIGRTDLAYDLLFQTEAPSWLYEVKMGATSIWENCFGYKEDGEPNNLSFNHYAFGCVADWIYRTVAGIRSDAPGYKHLIIQPMPTERLTSCERRFITEQGPVHVAWEKHGQDFRLQLQVPCNTTASVILPDGSRHEVGSGSCQFDTSHKA